MNKDALELAKVLTEMMDRKLEAAHAFKAAAAGNGDYIEAGKWQAREFAVFDCQQTVNSHISNILGPNWAEEKEVRQD